MTPTLNGVYARAIGVATILAASGAASAQETAQFMVQVSQATLAPGESAEVRVLVKYAPGVGGLVYWGWQFPQLGRVVGFSLAAFDLNASRAVGVSGGWSNLAVAPGFHPASSAGTIAGNNVIGAEIGTGFGPPLVTVPTTNPTLLWTGTWTASAGSEVGAVSLSTAVLNFGNVQIWLHGGAIGTYAVEDAWPCTNGQAVINVVPAPSTGAALCLGILMAPRRRR